MTDFEIWVFDVRQAYLQSTGAISRKVFIRDLPPDFYLHSDKCLKLLKLLYSLSESGELWQQSLDIHRRKDRMMQPLRFHSAIYV